ncbi:MAG: Txe/YoeB family addiction module toxin [Candidatus Symbiothrix sp.]|jgi:toxin YoeB|nr:Txe/YoeB family addiction module toxin [Candidatus Symbiothrix sp.]
MEITENRMDLIFKPKALDDRTFFKRSGNLPLMKKIQKLLEELELHPKSGTGKPEKLTEDLSGYWSRRINREHRIIYTIEEKTVTVYSFRGHYEMV